MDTQTQTFIKVDISLSTYLGMVARPVFALLENRAYRLHFCVRRHHNQATS